MTATLLPTHAEPVDAIAPGGALRATREAPTALSKSKLMAFRQCERRLWLEVHHPELRSPSTSAMQRFAIGHEVGAIAQSLFDADGVGTTIDPRAEGLAAAIRRTATLVEGSNPIFEAGFSAGGAMAFADALLPVEVDGAMRWRLVEVKSSTGVKPTYLDDIAVQAHVAKASGLDLVSVSLACVDSTWTYRGDGDYRGLLKEKDLTDETFARTGEVTLWIARAQAVVAQALEPRRRTGDHCGKPYECSFREHCARGEPVVEFPLAWLPGKKTKALAAHCLERGIDDLRHVPDDLLDLPQRRVKAQSIAGTAWFDGPGALEALSAFDAPLYFLDFETIQLVVPRWAGTRPYQQMPFQFSLHRLGPDGALDHRDFLDLTGRDPSRPFAEALVDACDGAGPVFVYNAAFEKSRIAELARRHRDLSGALDAIATRVVDLLPIARAHYYHPSQQGSWSIKKVLPAVVPALRYDALDGVQDGGAAMAAWFEATAPGIAPERAAGLRRQLLAYCALDTYAMVRLWQVFAQRADLVL